MNKREKLHTFHDPRCSIKKLQHVMWLSRKEHNCVVYFHKSVCCTFFAAFAFIPIVHGASMICDHALSVHVQLSHNQLFHFNRKAVDTVDDVLNCVFSNNFGLKVVYGNISITYNVIVFCSKCIL